MAATLVLLLTSLASLSTVTVGAHLGGMTLVPRQEIQVDLSFGYNDDRGPVNWANLNPQRNGLCARGRNQSPINVVSGSSSVTAVAQQNRPTFNYPNVDSAVFGNSGDTVKVVVGGSIQYDGATWNLLQWHVHTPSEHRLSDEHYPLEAHFVHQRAEPNPNGPNFLVLGLFFQLSQEVTVPPVLPGSVFPLWRTTLGRVEEIARPGQTIRVGPLNFNQFTQHFRSNNVYRYAGSLTAPPCSEGVQWLVSAAPVSLDVRTYNAVKRVVKFNSRPTQNTPGSENTIDLAANLFCPA